MYQKTFALTVRALRVDARHLSPHLMRAGLCFVVLLTLSSAQQSFSSQAPGLSFFSSIIYTNAAFASFVIPLLFANSITEEKEERTLPLLQIAGVSPLTILVGKSIPRMIAVLLIFVVQVPFSLLAVTLGGVSLLQILASYVAVAAYIIFVAFLSLWCSVIFRLTANAVGLAGLLLFGYHVLPTIVYGVLLTIQFDATWGTIAQTGIRWIGNYWPTNIFYRLNAILSTGFDSGLFSSQVGTNLLMGSFFFLLAWGTFPYFNRETDTAPAKKKSARGKQNARRRRAWKQALVWKEYYFAAGGKLYLVLKFIIYGAVIALVTCASAGWDLNRIEFDEAALISAAMMFFAFLPIETVLTVGRLFQPEVKSKTLPSLLLLPFSVRQIVYRKVLGGMLGLIPVLFYLALCTAIAPRGLEEFFREIGEHPGVAAIIMSNIIVHILLFLHLVAWLSIRMNGWWAILVSWFVHYFSFAVIAMIYAMLSGYFGLKWSDGTELFLAAIAAGAVLGVVAIVHYRIGRDLEFKAAEM